MRLGHGLSLPMSSQDSRWQWLAGLGNSYPAIYTTWLNRVVALGATPPDATKAAVGTFYSALVAAGFTMNDFDYMYLMIGENSGDTSANKYNQKRVNLASPGTLDATVTNPNASGHSASGTVGDTSMYWDTGFVNSGGHSGASRNQNASAGIVSTAASVGAAGYCECGTITAPAFIMQTRYLAGESYTYYGGSATTNLVSIAVPALILMNITTDVNTYRNNGASIYTSASGSELAPTTNVYLFGFNNGGTPSQRTNGTIAFAWHGRSMSAGERTSFYNAVKALMAAFSVTI